jgi:hypothetical protein
MIMSCPMISENVFMCNSITQLPFFLNQKEAGDDSCIRIQGMFTVPLKLSPITCTLKEDSVQVSIRMGFYSSRFCCIICI